MNKSKDQYKLTKKKNSEVETLCEGLNDGIGNFRENTKRSR